MNIQQRLLVFVTRSNWVLFAIASILSVSLFSLDFAGGIFFGGLIVTVNFHLLSGTLKKTLTPPHIGSHTLVLAKYYFRFVVSGAIIFLLIWEHIVDPVGLIIGLSVVVASIMLATMREIKLLLCKEAV
ncbi:MAG: ATP synthase subunit I [Desulfobacterales bacterium]|nr:ATP synthase subunit I [Desulfobacterales bacterium]